MVIFEIFKRQNLIKIYTKTHHLKNFSRGSIPPWQGARYIFLPNTVPPRLNMDLRPCK